MSGNKSLLAIIELGGYPDFSPLYKSYGYEVTTVYSMRKALNFLKKQKPHVIITEFNYQSDFRDRTSSLESLIAIVQRDLAMKVIVFYENEYQHQFERLRARYEFFATLSFPIEPNKLKEVLASL